MLNTSWDTGQWHTIKFIKKKITSEKVLRNINFQISLFCGRIKNIFSLCSFSFFNKIILKIQGFSFPSHSLFSLGRLARANSSSRAHARLLVGVSLAGISREILGFFVFWNGGRCRGRASTISCGTGFHATDNKNRKCRGSCSTFQVFFFWS